MPITWLIKNGNNNERFPFLETNNVKKKKKPKKCGEKMTVQENYCALLAYTLMEN